MTAVCKPCISESCLAMEEHVRRFLPMIDDDYRELRCLERDGAALSRVVTDGHRPREWRRAR